MAQTMDRYDQDLTLFAMPAQDIIYRGIVHLCFCEDRLILR